ncbi:vignain-like [Pyrus ussuriensis x Pyrus communis]|uniref:Vignain-like n=1 Tax=Pyrus ussuriensis x Pyrus communis TaxID=2448454 RepID=A0A5N5HRV7_9ROSA|nr:vignain-like [Pyrus ussuriensis x Pyrus communis]
MDRRKKGAATRIKDRRQCAFDCNRNIGCCRAFSAVAAIEGITQLTTSKLIFLSEQKLVGCDTSGVDQDCEGRLIDVTQLTTSKLIFLSEQKLVGCDTSGVDQDCEGRLIDDAFQFIQHHGISTKAKSVAFFTVVVHQPISVAIDASGFDFQFYSSGVLMELVEQAWITVLQLLVKGAAMMGLSIG